MIEVQVSRVFFCKGWAAAERERGDCRRRESARDFLSGTQQNMLRTVTICGALSSLVRVIRLLANHERVPQKGVSFMVFLMQQV